MSENSKPDKPSWFHRRMNGIEQTWSKKRGRSRSKTPRPPNLPQSSSTSVATTIGQSGSAHLGGVPEPQGSVETMIPNIIITCGENSASTSTEVDLATSALVPETCWEKALCELTDKQRDTLKAFGIENTNSLEVEIAALQSLKDGCTTYLSPGKDNKPIMTRATIHKILKKMEKYAVIGNIALQHNPNIVALVWAGVRFCLQVALNDMQTFERASAALDDIAGLMGSCRIYETIYSSWPDGLESAKAVICQLPRVYAHCLRFMAEAIDYFNTKTWTRVAKGITNPFETRFRPLIEDITNGKAELERCAAVAGHELQKSISETQKEEFGKLNDQLDHFRVQIVGVSRGVEGLLTRADEEERRRVLTWLSKVNFNAHHEKSRELRFNDTGGWLFGKPAFQNWIETECSSVMWLYGKAGSGKTILSSLVIDSLTETYKSIPTIYFYCHYGELERKETSSIIGSLLKQLSMRCETLDPKMMSAYKNGTSLDKKSSEISLAAVLASFEQTFIVVDALDECSVEERKTIVMLLTRLLKGSRVKIFLTSRPEIDLHRLLQDSASHAIDANDTAKDIRPFVAAALDDYITSGALLSGKVTAELREELEDILSVQADGMFLWAELQLDYICKQATEEEVRAQLGKLPLGLNNTYGRIWTKITEEMSNTERKWALNTLKWVLRAQHPLSPEEVLQAASIEPFDARFDQKRMPSSLDYLIQVCGNFVALDVQTNSLRFVHFSVQEFLVRKPEFDLAEDQLTEICFTVLGGEFHDFTSGRVWRYAAEHWGNHSRCWTTMNESRGNLIQRFLLDNQAFSKWNKNRYTFQAPFALENSITPYDAASYFGLPVILNYLQQENLHDAPFIAAQSRSLQIASRAEHISDMYAFQTTAFKEFEKVVQLLLDAGADVNHEGGEYGSALQAAASIGSERVVQMLLDAGADVNFEGGEYGSALQAAASIGSERVVQMLLDAGADVNLEGGGSGSALQAAASIGSERVVQMLLDAGADVNFEGGRYGSALQAAACNGFERVVQMLLDAGADVNFDGGKSGSALQTVIRNGFERVVQMLLDAGADVNFDGEDYGSALQVAASDGSERVVQMLLDAGADVNFDGGEFGSALQAAARNGSERVVQMLLDAGADVHHVGGKCGSALQAAAHNCSERVVQMLLDAGANVNLEGGRYGSALQVAASIGSERVVQMLLDAGADVHLVGGGYGSALQAAASIGSERVVQMLLDAGANVNLEGGEYRSALQAAAFKGSKRVVQMLLDAGADVNRLSRFRRSRLGL